MLLYLPTEIPSAIEIFLSYNSILSKLVEEKTNKQTTYCLYEHQSICQSFIFRGTFIILKNMFTSLTLRLLSLIVLSQFILYWLFELHKTDNI